MEEGDYEMVDETDANAVHSAKDDTEMETDEGPVVTFRNYIPTNELLKRNLRERASVPQTSKDVIAQLEKVASDAPNYETMDITPKKATWDLKRDIAPKLEKLERQTQLALIDLMRQKLSSTSTDMSRDIAYRSARDFAEDETEDE
eukprot:TRINITY_DN7148_c0_g1_i1.p1 TRINITY_DN7148_c0_g1~~TRINITY_DN7148_c0_g1_i1.p1  ORF type:complete len:146 (-),score=30.98 TRINITY_DN7148_c0_g1_i1:90-527(-)